MDHLYRPKYRPAGFATLPRGVVWEYAERPAMHGLCARNDIPASSHQFGIIRTDRALSADEIATYELERR